MSQFSDTITTLSLILSLCSVILGVPSLIVGISAAIYAYYSNRNTEELIKRLIIEPFRELDGKFNKLEPYERSRLIGLFRKFGKLPFKLDEVDDLGDFMPQTIETLIKEGWVVELMENNQRKLILNQDRFPYLTSTSESFQS